MFKKGKNQNYKGFGIWISIMSIICASINILLYGMLLEWVDLFMRLFVFKFFFFFFFFFGAKSHHTLSPKKEKKKSHHTPIYFCDKKMHQFQIRMNEKC